MNPKEILDRWATAVVPKLAIYTNKEGVDGVNQNKIAHYEERGYKGDEVLWIPPKDCIRLEFEDTLEHNHRYILEIESVAKSLGLDYCISGHGGKSDYFNMFNIKGMPLNDDNKDAKMLLVDSLMPKIAKDQLDRTNLGWTLSPIIGHEHWKKKYNGNIHSILRGKNPIEHNNIYPKELLNKLKKAKEVNKKKISFIKETSGWVEDFLLNYCCSKILPAGSRHYIIEKNLSAFILTRTDKETIKQRYYDAQGRKHDSMMTWERAILNGDYKDVSAGELAKFIKEHNLDFKVPPPQVDDSENGDDDENVKYTSLIIDMENEEIIEQVNKEGKNKFCVYNNKTKEINYVEYIDNGEIITKPIHDEEVEKKAVLLPSEPIEYGTDEQLDEDIKTFINKWLDIDEDTLQFALWNIKRSWVFERFHTLNYLRALGDTGQGKTRFIDTLGFIHYKPIETSGATTSAPIFRIINKWRGTLVMDEADFKDSDESLDIIKIINMGYERGKFVMRCDQNNAELLRFFDPYCPKVLATRKPFDDKATESRCITHVMQGTTRTDIPPNLNDEFFVDALNIRNKLLMWRFRNFFVIEPDKVIEFDFGDIEPRMKQIVTSLISLFGNDQKQLEKFKEFIISKQADLIDERQNSFAGQIVEGIYELVVTQGKTKVDAGDIIYVRNLTGKDGQPFHPRGLSKVLRELGFEKPTVEKIDGKAKKCLDLNQGHLDKIFKRYGYQVTKVTELPMKGGGQNDENAQKTLINDIVTDLDGLHRNGNNGNSVTEILDIFIKTEQEISTQWLITYFGIDNEDGVLDALKQLSIKGEIFECKPDVWRKL